MEYCSSSTNRDSMTVKDDDPIWDTDRPAGKHISQLKTGLCRCNTPSHTLTLCMQGSGSETSVTLSYLLALIMAHFIVSAHWSMVLILPNYQCSIALYLIYTNLASFLEPPVAKNMDSLLHFMLRYSMKFSCDWLHHLALNLLLHLLPLRPLQWTLLWSLNIHKTCSMSLQALMWYSLWLLLDWGWTTPGQRAMESHFLTEDMWLSMRHLLFQLFSQQMLGATAVSWLMKQAVSLLNLQI